jgi:broad specificity phosphatase PhoE
MKTMFRFAAFAAAACCTVQAHAQRTVLLVRHAELQGQVMAQPAETPLSDTGEARAARLAQMLKPAGITAIYTTEFVRTRKTAEPLARELKLETTVVAKAESATLVERLKREQPEGTVLVVAHSDTLPALLKALGHGGEVKIESTDYGNLFVWTPGNGDKPLTMRY